MATERSAASPAAGSPCVGAGEMGEGIAVALRGAGVGAVTVVNRTPERGHSLAERVNGVALGIDRLPDALADADWCSPARDRAIRSSTVRSSRASAPHRRPLLFVDIAVPRDVAADVAELPDVTVLDLDDLRAWAERGRNQRLAEVDRVRAIVAEEVERFAVESASLQAAPLVSSLRARAEDLRLAELDRHARRLAQLDDTQRELVEAITRGIVAKLLHEPSVRLRARPARRRASATQRPWPTCSISADRR